MGQIRRKASQKILKPFDDSRGYLRVSLNGKSVKIHRIIAQMFVPNPQNLPVVNHKKGNKHDNRASQLEWVTYSENTQHAYAIGLCKGRLKK